MCADESSFALMLMKMSATTNRNVPEMFPILAAQFSQLIGYFPVFATVASDCSYTGYLPLGLRSATRMNPPVYCKTASQASDSPPPGPEAVLAKQKKSLMLLSFMKTNMRKSTRSHFKSLHRVSLIRLISAKMNEAPHQNLLFPHGISSISTQPYSTVLS